MFNKMKAIDYNVLMTMLAKFGADIKANAPSYGIANTTVDILPSYPRDLSKFKKPAIIIRRVGASQQPIGLGSVLGQYYDEDTDTIVDVRGISHQMTLQIDICTDNNGSNLLFTGMISDCILGNVSIIKLYDYTSSITNPTEMGICTLIDEISTTNIEDSDLNNDYVSAMRFDINIIQAIVPTQEFVDLSKWIKTGYKIKL